MEYVNIETTQNINLEFKTASIGDRILATAFDLLIQIIWIIIWLIILGGTNNLNLWHTILTLPILFYSLLFELFVNGQTPGKMVLKTRVVKLDGSELTLGNCLTRWIFRLLDISLLSGTVALLSILLSNKSQRLGDIAAGTTVVKLTNNNLLEETTYLQVPENYNPKYPEVYHLSDSDAQTIKEVLNTIKKNGYLTSSPHEDPLLSKTRQAIQQKLKIEQLDIASQEFLENVLLDYNYLHQ